MHKKIPVILDVDTGIDDAVSMMLAAKSPRLDVKLVITCHGNTTIKNITKNTLFVMDLLRQYNIPVAEGMASPLVVARDHVTAHGADGLGGYKYENPRLKIVKDSAVEAVHKLLQNSKDPVTYICVAPSTNLANLIKTYPQDLGKIQEAVLMVGSNQEISDGEIPYKEFNASVDPEALEIVLSSSVKKNVVSMEMGHTAYLDWQDVYKTKITNQMGEILENIFRGYKDYHVRNGIATHDSCAVAYVIDSKIFQTKPAHMQVKYFKELGSGIGVVDYRSEPNVTITTAVNVKKMKKLFFKSLKKSKL